MRRAQNEYGLRSEVSSGYHVTTYEQGRDTSTNVMDDAAFQLLPAISTQQHSKLHRGGEGEDLTSVRKFFGPWVWHM